MMAIEFGWIFACTGRQPWVIYRLLKTEDVVTASGQIGTLFILFTLVYAILGLAVILVLVYYFKRNPVEKELDKPAGDGDGVSVY